jgi:ribose transport system permease protein
MSLQRRGLAHLIEPLFVPAIILLVAVYLALTSDVFLTWGNINNLLGQMVILGVASFGATFTILVRGLDLSVGAGAALASVFAATVMIDTGSPLLGILAGLGTGVVIGVLNGSYVTLLRVPPFIATLGMLVILRGVGLWVTDGGVVFGLPESFTRFSRASLLGLQYIVWVMILTFALLYFIERRTKFGLHVHAVGGNPEAARLAGIPVRRVQFLCFVISGFTMAVAGLTLMARVESGQPNGAELLELYAIAAIVIGGTSLFGGRGSVARTLAGVVLISLLRNGLDIRQIPYDVQQVVIGLVFIAAASVAFVRDQLEKRGWSRIAAAKARVGSQSDGNVHPESISDSDAANPVSTAPRETR